MRRKNRHPKSSLIPQLNLTSMVDIFTILLIFLLKSYSTSAIDIAHDLILPESVMEKEPVPTVTVSVTQKDILVDDEVVLSVKNIPEDQFILEPVVEKLLEKRDEILDSNREKGFEGNIILQADKRISYKILKKVLYSCGQVEFNDVSLAVLTKK